MTREHRREIGASRGVLRREKSHIISSDGYASSKAGRWYRSRNSVVACCSFIFTFFAVVLTVSYFFEPSILVGDGSRSDFVFLAPPTQAYKPSDLVREDGRDNLQSTTSYPDLDRIQPNTGAQALLAFQLRRKLVGNRSASSPDSNEGATNSEIRDNELRPVLSIHRLNVSGLEPLVSGNPLGLAHDIKIYIYELPSIYNTDWLADSRCSSHLFAAEVSIHRALLESPLRTKNPREADFFFVPVYVSCNFSNKNGFPSFTQAPAMMKDAVDLISSEAIYWNRSGGRDHIFVATHDYGACFHALENDALKSGIPKFLQNSILLQTFGSENRHPCQEVEHIQIPPYVEPQVIKKYTITLPERRTRDIRVHFRGKLELHPKNVSGQLYSKGIRTRLWQKYKREKRFFIRRKRLDGYQSEMLRSVFCLAPLGWAPWSPRIVEAVMYGCVPVIIADKISLPFSHAIDWPSISLTVREGEVDNLRRILRRVVATNLTTIQQNLWQEKNRRTLMFTQPLEQGDASWQIFDLLSQKKHERSLKLTLGGGATATS